jgi:hypothetical protein
VSAIVTAPKSLVLKLRIEKILESPGNKLHKIPKDGVFIYLLAVIHTELSIERNTPSLRNAESIASYLKGLHYNSPLISKGCIT